MSLLRRTARVVADEGLAGLLRKAARKALRPSHPPHAPAVAAAAPRPEPELPPAAPPSADEQRMAEARAEYERLAAVFARRTR